MISFFATCQASNPGSTQFYSLLPLSLVAVLVPRTTSIVGRSEYLRWVSNSVVEPSDIWRENAAHPRGKWLSGAKLNVTANRLTAKTTCTGSSIASCKSDAVLFSIKIVCSVVR
jgi:hypothetical protein